MARQVILTIDGLKTNPSPHKEQPGALKVAENVVIDRPNTAKSRRGIKRYGSPVTLGSGTRIKRFFNFEDKIIIHYDYSHLAYDSDDTGTWVDYAGSYIAPDSEIGIRSIKQLGSIYFTTTNGIKKLDGITNSIVDAGMVKALGGTADLVGATGFFTTDTQVAYRIVWGKKDANDINVIGAVSQRIEIANADTGDTCDVELTIQIPTGITTDHFYQIYRSDFSASADDVANDELGLIYEDQPTAAEITAKEFTFTDNVPSSLRGATIYTAPSQEGIANSNEIPPLAKDITVYKNSAIYANTKTRHRFYLTIIGVAGTRGIQEDDTITIGGVTYTAKVIEDAANGEFLIDTISASTADQIANTARSLVKTINKYSSNTTVYAYYISGYDDLPGKILIERRDLTDTSFALTVSANGDAYNPVLPTSGTTQSSENETKINRIYVSKPGIPEAVPITNYFDIGSQSSEIVRVMALRDSVFIFKDDGELYRLIGEDVFSFQISLFDNTVKLWGASTASVFNNQIYCFTDQGVVAVSDTGIEVKSWDIEDQILEYLSAELQPNFKSDAFGLTYESNRLYILSTGEEMFVYNSFTDSWTTWALVKDGGFVNETDDKLYFGDEDGYIYQEKKTYTKFDYSDDELVVTINSRSGYDIVLADVTGVSVGDSIVQGSNDGHITAVDTSTNTITIDQLRNFVAGAATVETPIECTLEWLPISAGDPMMMKRFTEMTVIFRDIDYFQQYKVKVKNNFNPVENEITMTPTSASVTWGSFPWGLMPWGGTVTGDNNQENRTYFPIAYQRALWQNISIVMERCFTNFTLNGVSVMFTPSSQRFEK